MGQGFLAGDAAHLQAVGEDARLEGGDRLVDLELDAVPFDFRHAPPGQRLDAIVENRFA
ncbi:hypothetical protein FQZ97_1244330 [compost metagenome]